MIDLPENNTQEKARLDLAEVIILITVELFKVRNDLPGKKLPDYLPGWHPINGICEMPAASIFEAGKRLNKDTRLWQALPQGSVILGENVTTKETLHGSLKYKIRKAAHEFGFDLRDL